MNENENVIDEILEEIDEILEEIELDEAEEIEEEILEDSEDTEDIKHYGIPGMRWGKRKAGGVTKAPSGRQQRRALKKEAYNKFKTSLVDMKKRGKQNDMEELNKHATQLDNELKAAKAAGRSPKKQAAIEAKIAKVEAGQKYHEGLSLLKKQGKENDMKEIVALSEKYDNDINAINKKKKEDKSVKHSDLTNLIMTEAKKIGSLKDSVIQHADTYGVKQIEELFPVEKILNKPSFINNNVEWVNKVLRGVNQLPFARVKTLFADISVETVRAKGYAKGDLKVEDVFSLLKRTTEPYTVYKKGKLDRDDIVDITDFDVVAWIKEAMRMKLDEEIARAILIGDGRPAIDEAKIDEECIRPIYNDSDLYTIKKAIGDEPNKYVAFINAAVRARKDYRGSGNPTLFTTEDLISELLLLEDTTGRRLYKGMDDLKSALRVSDIVTINEMADLVRETEDTSVHNVMGIIVNPADYSVGADKGGKVALFDDFDIDYNQQKYLIETRCAGALTVPYSAIVIEEVVEVVAGE